MVQMDGQTERVQCLMPHKKPVWSFNVKISPSERLNVSALKSLCAASGSTAMCMFPNRRLKPSKSMQQIAHVTPLQLHMSVFNWH